MTSPPTQILAGVEKVTITKLRSYIKLFTYLQDWQL